MELEKKYTVVVMDQRFVLTESQIKFDGPNYFTMCFLGDFSESQTRRLELSRDPDLFKMILKHLSGYTILPLNENKLSEYMSPSTLLTNLRVDAMFYQLEGLIQKCDEFLSSQENSAKPKYVAIGGVVQRRTDLGEAGELRCMNRDYAFMVFVTSEDVKKEPFTKLTRFNAPGGPTGFSGLRVTGAIGDILASKLGNLYHREWKLVGWTKEPDPDEKDWYQLVILAERT